MGAPVIDISLVRGATLKKNIRITRNGGAYTLAEGEVLRFGVKRGPYSGEYLIRKEWTAAEEQNGVYPLELTPQDTLALELGKYQYDVGLQREGEYIPVIGCSEFLLTENVTKWEGTANG